LCSILPLGTDISSDDTPHAAKRANGGLYVGAGQAQLVIHGEVEGDGDAVGARDVSALVAVPVRQHLTRSADGHDLGKRRMV
jgi:hypothetical protein